MMSSFQHSAIKRSLFVLVYSALPCFLSAPIFAEGQEQYLLITNEDLKDSFQRLVDHRCSQGMDGKLITVEAIDANDLFAGNDIQEKIRSCIQSYYDPNRTMFLVLGGDEHTVPVRYCDRIDEANAAPVDLYYADMDGTQWNADEDGIYGEMTEIGLAELTPEVCYGRIPVFSPNDVEAYLSKIFRYESIDPNEFEDSMLLLSGSGYGGCYEGPSRPPAYRDHDPVSIQEVQVTDVFLNIIQPFWQPGRLAKFFDTNTDWDVDRFGDFQQKPNRNIVSTLSKDFHYIYYWQHSNANIWTFPDEDFGSVFSAGCASALTNTLPSIIFARGCGTGFYDNDNPNGSLCEAFIKNPHGGPVVMFAHARSTGGSPHWDQIMRNVFQESHGTIGEAYRACLNVLAPQKKIWNQYVFLLLGDPALSLHRQTKRTLQLFSPKGNEVIDAGSDLFVRWNAGGSFSLEETVFLEYSDDDGETWYAIPETNDLPYNTGLFTWSHCPLPNGNTYRIRIVSTQNPELFSESSRSFTIANMGQLSVESSPLFKIRIDGTHSNQTEFTCSAIRNESFHLIAPDKWKIPRPYNAAKKDTLHFSGWLDANGILLSDSSEYEFVFDHDTTITALYDYPGEGVEYYINDAIAEDGIAAGDDNNNGLSPHTPMASIQVLLDRYPKIGYEDTIYISDGRYYENIDINSVHTGVTLLGAGHEQTVIDGGQVASCLQVDYEVICHLAHLGFENGQGTSHGGALQLGIGDVKCTIRNCRFENNIASGRGGAIYLAGSSALIGLEVYDSVFIRNHGNAGVMFTAKDARAEFHDCVFLENTARRGGAFRIGVLSSIHFENCVFEGNTADDFGGAIDVFSTGINIAKGCSFSKNEAVQGSGAICIASSSSMMLDDCVFEQNSSSSGGAIQIIGDGFSQIRRSTFQGNSANIGGAIEMEENSTSKIEDCTFENNDSSKGSGAIHTLGSSTVSLSRSIIKNNTGYQGGGLCVRNQSNVSANHCLFVSNVASKAGGAIGIYNEGVFSASNCTVSDNINNRSGGIAWHSFGDLTLVNSIMVYNPSKAWPDLRLSGRGTASVSYCCTPVQCEGIGNITAPLLFLDRDGEDYRLANDSPCIDTGSPETVDSVDLDGIIGPVDGNHDGSAVADIGAYEFCP